MQTDAVSFMPDIFGTAESGPAENMGKMDFLNLLVVQMQNQDPLEPMKNEQFLAQLAQFSSLEQMVNMNETLTNLSLLQSSINNSQAVNLIGKSITVLGDSLRIEGGSASHGSFSLAGEAESVTVTVKDGNGAAVRTVELGSMGTGNHDFAFDGCDAEGNALADGDYTFEVTAVDADGNALSVSTFADVVVEGISFSDGLVYLIAGSGRYLLSDIAEVHGS